MNERRTWEDFSSAGLLWFVNRILHAFGWTLVVEDREDGTQEVYPARTTDIGFREAVDLAMRAKFREMILKD